MEVVSNLQFKSRTTSLREGEAFFRQLDLELRIFRNGTSMSILREARLDSGLRRRGHPDGSSRWRAAVAGPHGNRSQQRGIASSRPIHAFAPTLATLTAMLLLGGASVAQAQPNWQQEFESLRRQVNEQQTIIEHQGQRILAQQGQLDAIDSQPAYAPGDFYPVDAYGGSSMAGYDGGFVIGGDPGDLPANDARFRMQIGSWGQFRHGLFESDGPNPDQNDFDIERLRLVFRGHAYNSNFKYFFQLDADSDARETVDMLDYYVTYDFGNDLFCWDKGKLALRLGKWKIGFNRAREESGTRMQFSDRSVASVLFDFNRSLGIALLGQVGAFDWEVGVNNGINTGGFRTSRAGELDRNFGVASRVNWLVTGDWGKDGHPDLDWRDLPAVRLGTGFAYTRHNAEGTREFALPRVVDSGALITDVLPPAVTAYNMYMHSVDLNVKYHGFSFIYEYYFRHFSGFSGAAVADLYDHGYWAEAGYFLVPHRLQVIARQSRAVGNSGTLGASTQSADEFAGGVVYYVRDHNLKLTFDATRLNGAPVSDSALGVRPGDAGWLFRTQFQWKF